MINSKEKKTSVLNKSIKEIDFYGHSFANADYSYFRALFDYFDIYNGAISLNFFYSVYRVNDGKKVENEQEARDNRSREQFERISRLLDRYGDTLQIGSENSLLHKLLLEGRLHIIEI